MAYASKRRLNCKIRYRMHQNALFRMKNVKKILGRGHCPLPILLPHWGGGYPLPRPHPLDANLDAFGVSILVPLARGPPYNAQCSPA